MASQGTLRKHFSCDFHGWDSGCQNDGTALSGTNTEINHIYMDGTFWEEFVIGTHTIMVPTRAAGGLDWLLDDDNADGAILVPGGHHINAPLVYTIGTDPAFFCEFTCQATDWSGVLLQVGFHGGAGTIQAFTGTWDDYTDKATIGNNAGGGVDLYTNTAINNAADVDTDTTINLTDGDVLRVRVNVSAAGAVTYQAWIAPTATPTVFTAQTLTTVAYSFDSGDEVVPLIYFLQHTDTVEGHIFQNFTCGYQDAA